MEYDGKNNNYGEIRIIIMERQELWRDKNNNTYYKYYVYKDNSIGFILDRCERGTISNDPPATIIGLEVPPSMILENILFQVL